MYTTLLDLGLMDKVGEWDDKFRDLSMPFCKARSVQVASDEDLSSVTDKA